MRARLRRYLRTARRQPLFGRCVRPTPAAGRRDCRRAHDRSRSSTKRSAPTCRTEMAEVLAVTQRPSPRSSRTGRGRGLEDAALVGRRRDGRPGDPPDAVAAHGRTRRCPRRSRSTPRTRSPSRSRRRSPTLIHTASTPPPFPPPRADPATAFDPGPDRRLALPGRCPGPGARHPPMAISRSLARRGHAPPMLIAARDDAGPLLGSRGRDRTVDRAARRDRAAAGRRWCCGASRASASRACSRRRLRSPATATSWC